MKNYYILLFLACLLRKISKQDKKFMMKSFEILISIKYIYLNYYMRPIEHESACRLWCDLWEPLHHYLKTYHMNTEENISEMMSLCVLKCFMETQLLSLYLMLEFCKEDVASGWGLNFSSPLSRNSRSCR